MSGETGTQIVLLGEENAYLLGSVADDVFDGAIGLDRLAAYLAEPGHLMAIAVSEGRVVGQARGIRHRQPDEADQFYIDNLGVAPAFRRRGIASALLRLLADEARRLGCASLWVATEADNGSAQAFYRSLGLPVRTISCLEGAL